MRTKILDKVYNTVSKIYAYTAFFERNKLKFCFTPKFLNIVCLNRV